METVKPQINIIAAIGNKVLCESLCHTLTSKQVSYTCSTDIHPESKLTPDIVLFNSANAIEFLQEKYPEAKFILMDTGLKEQEITYLLFYHKIEGVITPDTDLDLFLKALRMVNSGQVWIDNRHLKCLLNSTNSMAVSNHIKTFSRQDKKIVQLVAQGLKNREIAEKLYLSEHTIKAHISRIFKKLNINRRTQLVSLFLECGMDPQHEYE
ncbi:regulatory protein, luxR family [Malonomonas rubra DSM 5091]|uniref:Regulatory protein, luxR family n=1 Tax=Malonomonas rubra DSM 5091 TaxID=1122189 RepID=A0A1M6NFE2_MALRU|nr:response regulator transcription factor [Malonomonas rubra]SHJ94478.1 regulatory protein, luxR family [Malonomonas rubra DSM 5091]